MRKQLAKSAIEITERSVQFDVIEKVRSHIDQRYFAPNEAEKPLFVVVDFAIVEEEGNAALKVVELQGFASLFGYQYELAHAYCEAFALPSNLFDLYYIDIDDEYYWEVLRKAIIGDHRPEEVVLLEVDPWNQKTLPDFTALKKHLGIQILDILEVECSGRDLYYRTEDGEKVQIRRIFNRAIIDELEEKGIGLPSWWIKDVDVEWAGHPNWYFLLSKSSLPFIDHPAVPKTYFLSEFAHLPDDLYRYVLKPLYSFAGKGVIVDVTPEHIQNIPAHLRSQYILQEKVQYAEWIPTPYGRNKCEVRVMLVWFENEPSPIPLIPLVRTGRSSLMGVSYNNMPWAGSSTALFPKSDALTL